MSTCNCPDEDPKDPRPELDPQILEEALSMSILQLVWSAAKASAICGPILAWRVVRYAFTGRW